MFGLHVCLCIHCVHAAGGSQRRELQPLELGSQTVVGARSQTQMLCKTSQCS